MNISDNADKKNIAKTKSHNDTPPMKIRNETAKRNSFNLNDAVKSLDLALGRLKRSKFVTEENRASSGSVVRRLSAAPDMFMDTSSPSSNINPGIDTASVMSMNFSHYELMRNLSCSNTTSEGTFSGATDGQTDATLKNEHLEKYFRSAEMYTRGCDRCCHSNSVHYELAEK